MSTPEVNIWEIITGQDFREMFVVQDPTLDKIPNPEYDPECPEDEITNPKEIYQPKDLTGYTAQMDFRAGDGAQYDLIKSISAGLGITIGQPDPVDGSVEIFIDNTETEAVPFTDYKGQNIYADFFLLAPDAPVGDNKRLFKTTIPVKEAVTSFV